MSPNNQPSDDRVPLRIEVAGDPAITSQARTYAEYRVFAALVQSGGTHHARSVCVMLHQVPDSECGEVACRVTVRLESETVRVGANGAHAYAAINRAVERLKTALMPSSLERAFSHRARGVHASDTHT